MLTTLILASTVLTGVLLLRPVIRRNPLWRAMVTPLASIIGSGFLILGPVLAKDFGAWAPAVMAALCGLAWAFGMSIRANITRLGDGPVRETIPEQISAAMLAIAYVISVAYYLNLFGSFAVSLTPFAGPDGARIVTTTAYVLILGLGWTSGFAALERAEYQAVALKLAVIAGLLVALAVYFVDRSGDGALIVPEAHIRGWQAVTLGFGLLVTVQGFETSRYLGDEYSARVRHQSMKMAQGLSTAIYVIYVALLVFTLPVPNQGVTETEIIDLMQRVAPILPMMLVAAALAAQFSAAVADTGGSGGLVPELTEGRLSARQGYLALVLVGLALTWAADVFQIISYASRAFAAYYGMQSFIAARHARGPARLFHGGLALLAAAIAILGTPVEG